MSRLKDQLIREIESKLYRSLGIALNIASARIINAPGMTRDTSTFAENELQTVHKALNELKESLRGKDKTEATESKRVGAKEKGLASLLPPGPLA